MARQKIVARADYWFVGIFSVLLVIGLVMLSSVSTVVAFQKFGDPFYYIKHQFFYGVVPGLVALLFFSYVDYKIWRKFAFLSLVFSIVLLVAVFIPGLGYKFGGARSWLAIGPIVFQPSEVVKLTFLLYLSTWLAQREDHVVKDVSEGLIPFLTVLGVIMFLILMQPDVGTMSIIVIISLVVYFVGGASLTHLGLIGMLGAGMLITLIKIAPYRIARFSVFLHPEVDPQGIGYQINQALLAIGSGGLFGLGLGHSRQKYLYLPEVIGDSIFAVTAEELGFLFVVCIVLLYAALMYRGFRIAQNAPDKFGKLVVTGIIAWISIQAFINIGGMVSIIPLTGLTLPFMSYGSSSLVALLAAIGIVINVSKYAKVS